MEKAETSAESPGHLLNLYFGDERVLSVSNYLKEKQPVSVSGIAGSSLAFVIRCVFEKCPGIHIAVLPDKEQAAYLLNDLETLEAKPLFFPGSFRKPFATEEPDTSSIQLRAEVLNTLRDTASCIIVTSPEALAEKVISREYLEKNSLVLSKGEKISLSFLTDLLNEYGFGRCDYVVEPGQYSVRGGIVDVFSFSSDVPFRIELSGDEVESIRTFDTATQLSVREFGKASILPNIQAKLSGGPSTSLIPFILEVTGSLYVWTDRLQHIRSAVDEGMKTVLGKDVSENYLSASGLMARISSVPVIEYGNRAPGKTDVAFQFSPQPDFNKNFDLLLSALKNNTAGGYRNYIFCDSEKQSDRLRSIFRDLAEHAKDLPAAGDVFIPMIHTLHEGFSDPVLKVSYYTDHQVFGRYHRYRLRSSSFKKNEALSVKMLKSLQPGDYITHIDYGVGRFGGLEKISVNGKEQESIRLVYKDNDTLYISIHSLHQVSKYGGKESEAPKLDKLGSNAWTALKSRTKKKIRELAFDLVKLYAERRTKKGFAFSPDNYLQTELEASFIYEDTPDQLKATNDVKRDMEEEFPMDRLVCGDVGFGKTEIAIRAAFKAAVDGKQTAVLVPTTILALQHFKTFSDRMKGLPCTIDYISRFKSPKAQKETLKRLAEGKIDIIIGTHRLLANDVKFKDLGLMIVDEEQKFGVSSKDKLKLMKTNVDTLTLTATPIPRTLQFSMMGARDLSIINTPPPNRFPVNTEVHQYNERTIQNAINYEIQRGGQVFFVHNRVQNIGKYAEVIRQLCPQAKTLVAHGQLTGESLEKAMMQFIEGEYDVLVCTTIVESGLDIPNANTIIINDAQNYGLSDLHQLRGRVGRSNKKAFCYLLTPPFTTLTGEAKKRLRAIEEFSELGSGFNVAMRDLDIRGAGNLLGAEQSGFITEIGYEMYQKILDEAMAELKDELRPSPAPRLSPSPVQSGTGSGRTGEGEHIYLRDCVIDTDLSILIPDDYVENITERVSLYQQLDNSRSEKDLMDFTAQLADRFGPVPEPVQKLISVVRLRWLAIQLGFEKLALKNGSLSAWFVSNRKSPYYQSEIFSKVLQYVQNNPKICTMNEGESKLTLKIEKVKDVEGAMGILQKML